MEIEYLGYTVNTAGQLCLTEHRRSKVRRAASALLSGLVHRHCFVPFRQLRVFTGMTTSTYACCPLACLSLRGLYGCLWEYLHRYGTDASFTHKYGLPRWRVKLDKAAERELRWWAALTAADCATTLVAPSHGQVLWTDASSLRWGAVCDRIRITGDFPESI